MSKIKQAVSYIWQDESGQGATEYILILVVIGALVVAFRDPIVNLITGKTETVSGRVGEAISKIGI